MTRILCPIDFTLFSHHAIRYAVALARSSGATIAAVHVVPEPPTATSARAAQDVTDEYLERLKAQALTALQEAGAPLHEAVVVRGQPAAQIVRIARSLRAELIVMASHGRTGFAGTMCGSVTTDVLRDAPGAVLTVPRTAPVPAALMPFRRILCAIDFSPASLHALHCAVGLPAATGRQLVVLHVMNSQLASVGVAAGAHAPDAAGDAVADMWKRRLHEAVRAEAPMSVAVTEHVSEGDSADQILRMAAAEACDLIAIGAHRGNPLNRTMNQVVRRSRCAVLSVHG